MEGEKIIVKLQFVNWFPEWQKMGLHNWVKSHGTLRDIPFYFDYSLFLGFW